MREATPHTVVHCQNAGLTVLAGAETKRQEFIFDLSVGLQNSSLPSRGIISRKLELGARDR